MKLADLNKFKLGIPKTVSSGGTGNETYIPTTQPQRDEINDNVDLEDDFDIDKYLNEYDRIVNGHQKNNNNINSPPNLANLP